MSYSDAPYDSKGLANLLLDWAERDNYKVTPLKLQKLLFFVHADFLVATRAPLVREEFEAWSYGPVLPSVYKEFKAFSGSPILGRARRFDPVSRELTIAQLRLPETDTEELDRLYQIYIPVSAGLLSHRSHETGGPWSKALEAFEGHQNIGRRISNELILRNYCTQA